MRIIAIGVSLVVAAATGAGMMAEWPTLALSWYARRGAVGIVEPIFGKPISFFLFTLPAWPFSSCSLQEEPARSRATAAAMAHHPSAGSSSP
jgi:uncharacterized membrane protein (UPF0182 family)